MRSNGRRASWAAALVVVGSLCIATLQEPTAASAAAPARPAAKVPTPRAAGLAVADRLLVLQDQSGAIPDSPGGGVVNEDSNVAYALWGLAAGYRASGERRYLRGLRRGVSWLADRLVMGSGRWRGSFWYAYGSRPPYAHRPLSPGGRIADVRGVDASSALFVYDLWLYTKLSGNRDLARRLRTRALAAVDFVLTKNRAKDGFFYSSWQRRKGSAKWRLWRYEYAADQGDVWLGLRAASRLYGTQRHRRAARVLQRKVSGAFYLTAQRRFALGREQRRGDTAMEGFNGVFPQGYLPWVFPRDPRTTSAAAWLSGCAAPGGALRCGTNAPAYSLSAAVLTLAQRRTGGSSGAGALGWVLATTFHPATGAVGDSDRHRDEEYSNVDGFTALALLDPPPSPFRW